MVIWDSNFLSNSGKMIDFQNPNSDPNEKVSGKRHNGAPSGLGLHANRVILSRFDPDVQFA